MPDNRNRSPGQDESCGACSKATFARLALGQQTFTRLKRRIWKETFSKVDTSNRKIRDLFLKLFDHLRKKLRLLFLDARRSPEFQEIDKIRLQYLFRPVSGVDHRALIS